MRKTCICHVRPLKDQCIQVRKSLHPPGEAGEFSVPNIFAEIDASHTLPACPTTHVVAPCGDYPGTQRRERSHLVVPFLDPAQDQCDLASASADKQGDKAPNCDLPDSPH